MKPNKVRWVKSTEDDCEICSNHINAISDYNLSQQIRNLAKANYKRHLNANKHRKRR